MAGRRGPPIKPEEEDAEADCEGAENIAEAIGVVLCRSGKTAARWITRNKSELQ